MDKKIVEGEAVTLSHDREYLCAKEVAVGEKEYLYLVSVGEPVEVCFAEQNGDSITVINDSALKQEIAKALRAEVAEMFNTGAKHE